MGQIQNFCMTFSGWCLPKGIISIHLCRNRIIDCDLHIYCDGIEVCIVICKFNSVDCSKWKAFKSSVHSLCCHGDWLLSGCRALKLWHQYDYSLVKVR